MQIGADVESIDVFGQVELVRGIGHDVLRALVLVHPRTAKGEEHPFVRHRAYPFIEVELQIGAADKAVVDRPIAALLARESLYRNALAGFHDEACPEKRIIHAEAALFVSAENKAGAELLVERPQGQLRPFVLALDIHIRHAPPFETRLETRQRVFGELETRAGINVPAHNAHVGIGVGLRPIVGVFGADLLVVLGDEDIAHHTAAHRHFLSVVLRRS